jgi:hypothetical protein
MAKSKKTSVDRRGILKGAVADAAVLESKPQRSDAQQAPAQTEATGLLQVVRDSVGILQLPKVPCGSI